MLAALKYKQNILDNFYLDVDDITIKRKKDHTRYGRSRKGEEAKSYTLRGEKKNDYRAICIPGAGSSPSISVPWILTVLRGIPFDNKSVLDHIDGNIANNMRDNLRVTTQELNCKNRKIRSDNTSGYTGLTFHKPTSRWVVRRTIRGKRIWKSDKTLEGAIEIWKQVEKDSWKDGYTKRHGY